MQVHLALSVETSALQLGRAMVVAALCPFKVAQATEQMPRAPSRFNPGTMQPRVARFAWRADAPNVGPGRSKLDLVQPAIGVEMLSSCREMRLLLAQWAL